MNRTTCHNKQCVQVTYRPEEGSCLRLVLVDLAGQLVCIQCDRSVVHLAYHSTHCTVHWKPFASFVPFDIFSHQSGIRGQPNMPQWTVWAWLINTDVTDTTYPLDNEAYSVKSHSYTVPPSPSQRPRLILQTLQQKTRLQQATVRDGIHQRMQAVHIGSTTMRKEVVMDNYRMPLSNYQSRPKIFLKAGIGTATIMIRSRYGRTRR